MKHRNKGSIYKEARKYGYQQKLCWCLKYAGITRFIVTTHNHAIRSISVTSYLAQDPLLPQSQAASTWRDAPDFEIQLIIPTKHW